jgi:DNA-directed RNA polymerase subunit RPC12/RpoP
LPYNHDVYKKWSEANREKIRANHKKWREAHPETVKENHTKYLGQAREYKKIINVKKRCPECRKQFTIRKDRKSKHCPYCGVLVRVSRTLSANPNSDTAHGIRLKVV